MKQKMKCLFSILLFIILSIGMDGVSTCVVNASDLGEEKIPVIRIFQNGGLMCYGKE